MHHIINILTLLGIFYIACLVLAAFADFFNFLKK